MPLPIDINMPPGFPGQKSTVPPVPIILPPPPPRATAGNFTAPPRPVITGPPNEPFQTRPKGEQGLPYGQLPAPVYSTQPSWYLNPAVRTPQQAYPALRTGTGEGATFRPPVPGEFMPSGAYATTPQDYFQRYLYNAMLPYLDPMTQVSTGQWLARDYPSGYGQYENIPQLNAQARARATLSPTAVDDYMTRDRINAFLGNLDYNQLIAGIPDWRLRNALQNPQTTPHPASGDTNREIMAMGQPAQQDIRASLNWLTEALRTAGTGAQGSRAQQNLAKAHLATLYREAEQEPERAGRYKTLFENLTNPVTTRAPLSGMFGSMRTTIPQPEFKRKGVAFRNPLLT